MPNLRSISLPTSVSALWNAGRQCMNFTSGLPVAAIAAALTWYGISSSMRSAHTSSDSPIETQTSVSRKSQPRTASSTFSVIVMRPPLASAKPRAAPRISPLGHSDRGAAIRTSMPSLAPIAR